MNVGGDLRVAGAGPEGDGWIVAIDDPTDADRVVGTLALDAGAVASTLAHEARLDRGGRHDRATI